MKFDKSHKTIINTLTEEEAPVYIEFLEMEIDRHQKALKRARDFMDLWETEVILHREDIIQATARIGKVKREVFE